MRHIHLAFYPKDEVWIVDDDWTPQTCPTCEGHKFVSINGESFPCPKCHAKGTLQKTDGPFPQKAYKATVEEVIVRATHNTFVVRRKDLSGSIHASLEDLYASEDAAQAAARKANESEKSK